MANLIDVVAGSSHDYSTNGPVGRALFYVDGEIITSLEDISDEELRCFVELHGDPINDTQIELYIYACFYLSARTFSARCLEQAIQQIKRWIAVTSPDDPDRARRVQILDTLSMNMRKFTEFYKGTLPTAVEDG